MLFRPFILLALELQELGCPPNGVVEKEEVVLEEVQQQVRVSGVHF